MEAGTVYEPSRYTKGSNNVFNTLIHQLPEHHPTPVQLVQQYLWVKPDLSFQRAPAPRGAAQHMMTQLTATLCWSSVSEVLPAGGALPRRPGSDLQALNNRFLQNLLTTAFALQYQTSETLSTSAPLPWVTRVFKLPPA